MLTLRYGGQSIDEGKTEARYREGWQGLLLECQNYVATLNKGNYYPGKGSFDRWSIAQSEGDVYNLDLEFLREFDQNGNESNLNTATGPLTSELRTKLIRLPLNSRLADGTFRFDYRVKWDHYLIALGGYADLVPAWWDTDTDPVIYPSDESYGYYRWIKNLAQLPTEATAGQWWRIVAGNGIICEPTKPGVTGVDYALYEITETGKHTSKNNAGWAVTQMLNSVVASPILGDFGITAILGGNWKVSNCSVKFNGKYWVSTRSYELSGDAIGWDPDFYGE